MLCMHASICVKSSAVVDKIGDKTAIMKRYDMSTKILFCQHNHTCTILKKKVRPTFKKQNIDKISHQKGSTVCEKHAVNRVQRHA